MATEPRQENPPLGKSYVSGYSSEDTSFPILHIRKDPRAANYKTPALGDPHPEAARYPNHVYTGTIRTDTDERIIWVYEILDGPDREGQEFDETLGVRFPYTITDIVHGTHTGDNADIQPESMEKSVMKTVDLTAAAAALDSIYLIYPTRETLPQMPDVLESVDVFWNPVGDNAVMTLTADANAISSGYAPSDPSTITDVLADQLRRDFDYQCSASVTGGFNRRIRRGFAGSVPADIHTFFLPFTSGGLTSTAIVDKIEAKLTALAGSPVAVSEWPVIRPTSHNIVLTGQTKRLNVGTKIVAVTPPGIGYGTGLVYLNTKSESGSASIVDLEIPPTIHGEITISETGTSSATGSVTDLSGVVASVTANGTLSETTIAATTPSAFTPGKYILTSDVQLYKYGYARVTAVVVDVTSGMI